jgi:hypothetical protein
MASTPDPNDWGAAGALETCEDGANALSSLRDLVLLVQAEHTIINPIKNNAAERFIVVSLD